MFFVISLIRSGFVFKVLAHIKMVLETKKKNQTLKMSNNVVIKFLPSPLASSFFVLVTEPRVRKTVAYLSRYSSV